MATESSSRWRLLSWLVCSTAMIPLGVFSAAGQQPDPLRQQLDQLKQEYETTTQALQLCMAALEQQIESQKESTEKTKEATISAVDLALYPLFLVALLVLAAGITGLFKRKGRFAELMERIPVHVVVTPAGLAGAAVCGLEGPDSTPK